MLCGFRRFLEHRSFRIYRSMCCTEVRVCYPQLTPKHRQYHCTIAIMHCRLVLSFVLEIHLFNPYEEMEMCEKDKSGEIRLVRESKEYWRVTFDIPPLNIFGPANIPQLEEIVSSLESDE